jgi:glycosyltransferase involved in cell wall biosynthesis
MKVCILTTAFPRWREDTHAPFIFEAVRNIQNKGVNLCVVAMHNPGSATKENWNGVEIIRPRYLPERFENLRKEGGGLPATWKKNPLGRLALFPFLIVHSLELIRQARKCNLIHAQWTLSGIICWLTKWLHHKPFIVTVHGSDIVQGGKIPLVRWFTRKALNSADQVIVVSSFLRDASIALGVKPNHVVIIPNGVDPNLFHPYNGKKQQIVLYVGSLNEYKGCHILIEAMKKVLIHFPSAKLKIIGEGPQKKEWNTLVKSLKLGNHVDFLGQLSQSEVAQQMRSAYILVLPSFSEGFGVVLLEAMASGTLCIGSEIGGIPDIIRNTVCKLVPPGNPDILAESIIGLFDDSKNYAQNALQVRKLVEEKFSWDLIADQIVQIYKSVANSPV